MTISKIEQAQLDILDALLEEGGRWSDCDANCLLSLAKRVFGEETEMGSHWYKTTSLAILGLEQHGLVKVERRYQDEAQRANVIEAISVT